MKKKEHLNLKYSPLVVLVGMQRIEEAYKYWSLKDKQEFARKIKSILDGLGGCEIFQDSNGRVQACSSVLDTITQEKDDEFYPEMLDAIIRVGDTFISGTYPEEGKSEQGDKLRQIYISLINSLFPDWYYRAKRVKSELTQKRLEELLHTPTEEEIRQDLHDYAVKSVNYVRLWYNESESFPGRLAFRITFQYDYIHDMEWAKCCMENPSKLQDFIDACAIHFSHTTPTREDIVRYWNKEFRED